MKRSITIACAAALSSFLALGCAQTAQVTAGSLSFHASTQWAQEAPGHASRQLQLRIPSHQEGVEDAKLIVWNFSNMRDAGHIDGDVFELFLKSKVWLEYAVRYMPNHAIDPVPLENYQRRPKGIVVNDGERLAAE